MKKHIIHQPDYHRLLAEYKANLQALGYGKSSTIIYPTYLQEFLYNMEQQQTDSIAKITQSHITAYHGYLQQRPTLYRGGALSSSSISQHLFAIRIFFGWLERTGQIQASPMSALVFTAPVKTERTILSQTEIRGLYQAAETLRDKAILNLFYGCGLRRGEAIALDINDIHFGAQLLYVREGKGKKRRAIPMTAKVTHELKNYLLYERNSYVPKNPLLWRGQGEAFILNNTGTRMQGLGYDKLLKSLLEKSALTHVRGQISLHHLRHSIASHLLENGVKMTYVRDFLGHSSLNTTQVYTHIQQRQLKHLK
jgi:integrase/recombinase XerD